MSRAASYQHAHQKKIPTLADRQQDVFYEDEWTDPSKRIIRTVRESIDQGRLNKGSSHPSPNECIKWKFVGPSQQCELLDVAPNLSVEWRGID